MSNEMQHIRTLYRLLFDVATGRPLSEQAPSLSGDFYDLGHTVYTLGTTLRNLVIKSGMVPPYATYEHATTYVLILDRHFRIIDLNVELARRLGYSQDALRDRNFESLLVSQTIDGWRRFIHSESPIADPFSMFHFIFVAANGSKLPLVCAVCDALWNSWIFLLSVEVHLVAPDSLPESDTMSKKAIAILEQLHYHILKHLDEALPSLEALSATWGLDPQTLHHGFKHYYGSTPYQFYQEARLKKGYHLILSTRLQLKEIGYQCGFSAYINFYKAFKKFYGFAPSALLRP